MKSRNSKISLLLAIRLRIKFKSYDKFMHLNHHSFQDTGTGFDMYTHIINQTAYNVTMTPKGKDQGQNAS